MATLQFSQGDEGPPRALNHEKQLLNNVIDGMAATKPSAIYAEIPIAYDTYDRGYRRVTYKTLASAINGVAWWLKEKLGEGRDHQTLTYIGPNDLNYIIMILGAVKAGYKLLLLSPRNAINDQIALLEATDCWVLITAAAFRPPTVQEILNQRPLRELESPSLDDLLVARCYTHYPYPKTFAKAKDEPLFVVHTSGTTTVPKPIIYTHDFVASYVQYSQLAPPLEFESQVSLCQANRFLVTLPFFHVGNLFATLFDALANQTTVITLLGGVVPTAQLIVGALKQVKANALLLAPLLLEDIAKSPEMSVFVTSAVEVICYGGGDVSPWVGEKIASKVQLFNFYGSTETGNIPLIRPTGKYAHGDWKCIRPHPAAGMDFRASLDGQYESVIIKNTVQEDEQPVFKLFPNLHEYLTRDLWKPHPSIADSWLYHGRADNVIVFKPGNKCDPITMEHHVAQHPDIKGVLMAGTGRSQPALVIERAEEQHLSPAKQEEFTAQLWSLIQEANQKYKLSARVSQSHILYTEPQRPMLRAGKGTIQRSLTLELYKDVLDDLYNREGDAFLGNELSNPTRTSELDRKEYAPGRET
ncbi:MAG: hypothetical protein Q9225_001497 [Loekoesia sp. 1 TL-2023]